MNVRLYIEGGGESRSLHITCREGFRKVLESAGFKGRMPQTRSCGSRNQVYQDFNTALRNAGASDYPILLVDSEGPVNRPAWEHLMSRDGWARPDGVDDEQAQLMVQCMETWCVSDRPSVRAFFGQCLRENALPALHGMEDRAKDDVQAALSDATRECGRDRAYEKGKRSFELLGHLDPTELKGHLPHFVRLCSVLTEKL